ncbi:MAG: Glycosyl transferase, group 1 family protein, partial [Candidatus Gottesmanbacteria bacterium GW2011_GWC2_42_8]
MQIAFLSYWSCPRSPLGVLSSGGMNVYILNLAAELTKLGHRVDIFTKSHSPHKSHIINIRKNIRLIHLKGHIVTNLTGFIKKNSLRYDILHAHYYYSAEIGVEVSRQLKLPLAVTFHTLGEMKKIYAGIIDKSRIETEQGIVGKADAL